MSNRNDLIVSAIESYIKELKYEVECYKDPEVIHNVGKNNISLSILNMERVIGRLERIIKSPTDYYISCGVKMK